MTSVMCVRFNGFGFANVCERGFEGGKGERIFDVGKRCKSNYYSF